MVNCMLIYSQMGKLQISCSLCAARNPTSTTSKSFHNPSKAYLDCKDDGGYQGANLLYIKAAVGFGESKSIGGGVD